MPAILRNSLPNLLASHTVSGQSLPFGVVVGSRPGGPPWCMVATACGSATLCHVVGGSTIRCFAPPPLDSLASWSILSNYSGVFGLVLDVFTNPYQILCPPCERAWCIRFGPHATYQSLPHSTCKTTWFLVWSPGMVSIGKAPPIWLRTCHCPPLPAIHLRHGG